jgi:sterol desaturase/sphingolipid hydroxylase (fatty acid hydroxylase superfamily)
MKLYVSNKKETVRMFKSGFMEFFSRTHWTVPIIIFVPIITALSALAVTHYGLSYPVAAAGFLFGLGFWTLVEYLLHRFLFHYSPTSDWGRKIHWTFHGVHHDYPGDPLRLVMAPAVSLTLGAAFYGLFTLAAGAALTAPIMAGLIAGYLVYDISHFALHHFPLKGRIMGALREHHMRHHFQQPEAGFGVSSPLWDMVFRTGYK